MKKIILLLFFTFNFFSFTNAQKFETFKNFDALKDKLIKENDTLYVVNFWATWCAPCVKELPYFEKLTKVSKDKKFKVILVSLDFPKEIDKRLKPFLKKRQLKSKVVLLSDTKYNNWLSKIDKDWSGSIPATWLVLGNKKKFLEEDFKDFEALENFINEFINPKN